MEEWIGNIGGMLQYQAEVCLHEDRRPTLILSTINPAWTRLLIRDLRDEGPATTPLRVH